MALHRQTGTLVSKTLRIVVLRHSLATIVRALLLPVALMTFLGFSKNLFIPPAVFGISEARPVRSLANALEATTHTGRNTVVFVNQAGGGGGDGGSSSSNSSRNGSDIDRVIDILMGQVESAGKTARRLTDQSDLGFVCKSTLNGVTPCYGAVVFWSSPTEGPDGLWNYTLRLDGALSNRGIKTNRDNNDAQLYVLPFQRAVDAAITSLNNGTGNRVPLPNETLEYAFTTLTQEERAVQIRVRFEAAIFNFYGVVFLLGMVGIVYHMTGFIATEREIGMAQLVEAMMPVKRRWHAQAARLLSYHVAFTLVYLPGWIIGAFIVRAALFAVTNAGIVVIYHILAGLALGSMSLLGASFFRKSQLSGITTTLAAVLLGILAQTLTAPSTGAVLVLSLLFAPCNYVYFISYMARYEQDEFATDLLNRPRGSPWNIPGLALWLFLVLQIFVYPLLGAWLERYFHGGSAKEHTVLVGDSLDGRQMEHVAVRLEGFTKIYKAGWFRRRVVGLLVPPKEPVVAVDGLTLAAGRGQILALLGANGSGKSTTLDAIAGTNRPSGGTITIDGTGGLGIAPQKNVLWDELTVEEHITIFNRLKAPNDRATSAEIRALVASIDLEQKRKAQSSTLSGGQKRKLQLGMMLTGGSAVCCVDEVSSGLDPLSRRKIWDILLAERGRRTIILTTHFLDEADLLADHIAILSRGTLKAEGSSVELKNRLGAGYRIHVPNRNNAQDDQHEHQKDHQQDQQQEHHVLPNVDGVRKKVSFDVTSYLAPSSALAAQVIRALEAAGVHDYKFSGPTIEDVFLQLAEEVRGASNEKGATADSKLAGKQKDVETVSTTEKHQSGDEVAMTLGNKDEDEDTIKVADRGLELLAGRRIGYWRQAAVLFRKRCTVFKSNWFPYAAAFFIPVAAAGLVTLFVKGQKPVGCAPTDQSSAQDIGEAFEDVSYYLVAGPRSKINLANLGALLLPIIEGQLSLVGGPQGGGLSSNASSLAGDLFRNLTLVDTLDEFENFVATYRKNVTPAGWWLGDTSSPTPRLAYRGNLFGLITALVGQNFMDVLLTNTTIATSYAPFDIPWSPDTGKSMQLLTYFGLALAAYPGFFALYPNIEKRRNVRGLEYSNGVRALPLWMAYLAFDFLIVLFSSALVVILFAALSSIWYHIGYLFIIFVLYGLASILLAYVVSLFSRSQLSAYAFVAAGQAVMFLVYLIAYLSTFTYSSITEVDRNLRIVHFVVAAVVPIGSIIRTLFIALNLFSTACKGFALNPDPDDILVYGGPILYLILQSLFYFALLLWFDAGAAEAWFTTLFSKLFPGRRPTPTPASDGADPERSAPQTAGAADSIEAEGVRNELARVATSASNANGTPAADADGLCVLHLSKSFGRTVAVDDVSFGIRRGEVFALLGPNGAGKSTTISLIRGDMRPTPTVTADGSKAGDILVESVSVLRHRAQARSHLGVCPQFDAVDAMTVEEHLEFYARVRGVSDVAHNVEAVLRAVGLTAFRTRMAAELSGGNRRKLSLAIALMGNPAVVLLDEPSSGLDAAAKRIMWRTLAAIVPGRCILLTTHSMEEADALAGRAGILATRMLALGTTDALRRRWGDRLHVHIVAKGAPRTDEETMVRLRAFITSRWPGAVIDAGDWHGQLRFSVPAAEVLASKDGKTTQQEAAAHEDTISPVNGSGALVTNSAASGDGGSALGRMVVLLEEHRNELAIEHYAVSPTTLDQVFLTIVGSHNVHGEDYDDGTGRRRPRRWWVWPF